MDTFLELLRIAGVLSLLVAAMLLMGYMAAKLHQRNVPQLPDELVRCAHGDHPVSRHRAIGDGSTYDGQPIYICARCLLARKRMLHTGDAA